MLIGLEGDLPAEVDTHRAIVKQGGREPPRLDGSEDGLLELAFLEELSALIVRQRFTKMS